jgi:hypothetical protein
MPREIDIQVVDPDGNMILLAEVKSRANRDLAWARQYRRNLLAHGALAGQYLLLVTRDDSFLWHNGHPSNADDRDPDKVAPTKALLGPAFGGDLDRIDLSGTALEHLVAAWLSTIAEMPAGDMSPESRQFVLDTGLWHALRDADVRVA